MLKFLISSLFISCIYLDGLGQNAYIDSLEAVIKTSDYDSNKVKLLNTLGWQLKRTGNYEKAMAHTRSAIELSEKLKFQRGLGQALGNMGVMLNDIGKPNEAMRHHKQALAIRQKIGDMYGTGNSFTNIGHIMFDKSDF